jgi:hypothetical protein
VEGRARGSHADPLLAAAPLSAPRPTAARAPFTGSQCAEMMCAISHQVRAAVTDIAYRAHRYTKLMWWQVVRFGGHTMGENGKVSAITFDGYCPACNHLTRYVTPVAVVVPDAGAESTSGRLPAQFEPPATIEEFRSTVKRLDIRRGQRLSARTERRDPPTALVVAPCQCVATHEAEEPPTKKPDRPTVETATHASGESGDPAAATSNEYFGCGARWMMRVTYEPKPDTPVTFRAATSEEESHWPIVQAIQTAGATSLTDVRTSASTWQTALTGIIAILGLSALIGGRDALTKMETGYAWAVTIGLLIVLLLSALASYHAQKAASGVPTFKALDDVGDLDSYAQDPVHQAVASADRLRYASRVTALAFAVGLGVLFVWLRAPDTAPPPPEPSVAVTFDNGESFPCVTLLRSSDPRFVDLQPADGPAIERNASSVASIGPGSC